MHNCGRGISYPYQKKTPVFQNFKKKQKKTERNSLNFGKKQILYTLYNKWITKPSFPEKTFISILDLRPID